MFSIVLKQVKKHFQNWIGFIILITFVSFFIGICVSGIIVTIMDYPQYENVPGNPIFAYRDPLIYGSIVFVFVVGNIIRMNIDSQKEDFRLFALMGAKPGQLSGILSFQSFFLSLLGGLVGYFLAIIPINPVYNMVTESNMLLPIEVGFNWVAMLISLGLVLLISTLSSYIHSHSYFRTNYYTLGENNNHGPGELKFKWYQTTTLIVSTIALIVSVYKILSGGRRADLDDLIEFGYMLLEDMQWLFITGITLVLLIVLLRGKMYKSWLSLFQNIYRKRQSYIGFTAASNLKHWFNDQLGIVSPLIFVAVLINTVLIMQDPIAQMFYRMGRGDEVAGSIGAILNKFGTGPLVVIIMNLVVLYNFVAKKSKSHDCYYLRIGSSQHDLVKIRLREININTSFVFVVTFLASLFIYLVISAYNLKVGLDIVDPWQLIAVPLIVSVGQWLVTILESGLLYLVHPAEKTRLRVS